MHIILLGLPGSGKGTLAKHLQDKHQFVNLSTGNIFRDQIANKKTYGPILESYLKQGLLVPDDLTNKVVASVLSSWPSTQNIVFDGYPRTVAQAEFLAGIIRVDWAFSLVVPPELLGQRVTGRRYCPACLKNYNIFLMPPQKEGVCDADDTQLEQRNDDSLEILQTRLQIALTNLKPLLAYYEKLGIVKPFDASMLSQPFLATIDAFLAQQASR